MRPKGGNLKASIHDIRLHDEAQTGNVQGMFKAPGVKQDKIEARHH